MLDRYTQPTATIGGDINFIFYLEEKEKLDPSKLFRQNTSAFSEFGFTTGTIVETISSSFGEEEMPEIPEPSTQNTITSRELSFEEEIVSGITQDFTDQPVQQFDFLSYNEEDLLDWDTAIIAPPPRPSGTIRVKLKYKGRSQPFPAENFWEE